MLLVAVWELEYLFVVAGLLCYTYIHTYMHACMHACMHTSVHIYIYTHTYHLLLQTYLRSLNKSIPQVLGASTFEPQGCLQVRVALLDASSTRIAVWDILQGPPQGSCHMPRSLGPVFFCCKATCWVLGAAGALKYGAGAAGALKYGAVLSKQDPWALGLCLDQ